EQPVREIIGRAERPRRRLDPASPAAGQQLQREGRGRRAGLAEQGAIDWWPIGGGHGGIVQFVQGHTKFLVYLDVIRTTLENGSRTDSFAAPDPSGRRGITPGAS